MGGCWDTSHEGKGIRGRRDDGGWGWVCPVVTAWTSNNPKARSVPGFFSLPSFNESVRWREKYFSLSFQNTTVILRSKSVSAMRLQGLHAYFRLPVYFMKLFSDTYWTVKKAKKLMDYQRVTTFEHWNPAHIWQHYIKNQKSAALSLWGLEGGYMLVCFLSSCSVRRLRSVFPLWIKFYAFDQFLSSYSAIHSEVCALSAKLKHIPELKLQKKLTWYSFWSSWQ